MISSETLIFKMGSYLFIGLPVFRGLHHECLEAILRKS